MSGDMPTDFDVPHPPHRGLTLILMAVSALAAAGIGVGVAAIIWQPAEPWAPLGDYPTQKVLDRVPGVIGPAATVDAGTITVDGTKCTAPDIVDPVSIRGSVWWVTVEPPGTIIQIVDDVAGTRAPGCTTRRFSNAIPAEVVERTARHGGPVVWHITAEETPHHPDRGDGVPAVWTTDNFTLIPPTDDGD